MAAGDFPTADVTILGLQAARLAQLELVGAFPWTTAVIRDRRYGAVWPAAGLPREGLRRAFERQGANGSNSAREAGAPDPQKRLAEHLALVAGQRADVDADAA